MNNFRRKNSVSAYVEIETHRNQFELNEIGIRIWNTFPGLTTLLDHGTMVSIKICRFKTFLEECFDKEPSSSFCMLTSYYMLKIVFRM